MTAALTAEALPVHPASQAVRIFGVTLVGVSTATAVKLLFTLVLVLAVLAARR